MPRFDSLSPTLPQAAQPQAQAVRRDTPARAPSVGSDVGVPLLWALVTGLITGIGLYVAGGDLDLAVAWFGITLLTVWLAGLYIVIRSLYAHERPEPAQPAQPDEPARDSSTILISPRKGRDAQDRDEREHTTRQVWEFLVACEAGHTDLRYWQAQRDVVGNRVMSDATYRRHRDGLIDAGHASWLDADNHAAGWHLNAPATAIMPYVQVD